MTMNAYDARWHKCYQEIQELATDNSEYELKLAVIKDSFHEVVRTMRVVGMPTSMDDRAEQLIAAITRYVLTCETAAAFERNGL